MKGRLLSIALSVTVAAGLFLMPEASNIAYAGDYPVFSGENLALNTPTEVSLYNKLSSSTNIATICYICNTTFDKTQQ